MPHPPSDDPNDPLIELELHVVPAEMTAEDYIARCQLVNSSLRLRDKILRQHDYVSLGEA